MMIIALVILSICLIGLLVVVWKLKLRYDNQKLLASEVLFDLEAMTKSHNKIEKELVQSRKTTVDLMVFYDRKLKV